MKWVSNGQGSTCGWIWSMHAIHQWIAGNLRWPRQLGKGLGLQRSQESCYVSSVTRWRRSNYLRWNNLTLIYYPATLWYFYTKINNDICNMALSKVSSSKDMSNKWNICLIIWCPKECLETIFSNIYLEIGSNFPTDLLW